MGFDRMARPMCRRRARRKASRTACAGATLTSRSLLQDAEPHQLREGQGAEHSHRDLQKGADGSGEREQEGVGAEPVVAAAREESLRLHNSSAPRRSSHRGFLEGRIRSRGRLGASRIPFNVFFAFVILSNSMCRGSEVKSKRSCAGFWVSSWK